MLLADILELMNEDEEESEKDSEEDAGSVEGKEDKDVENREDKVVEDREDKDVENKEDKARSKASTSQQVSIVAQDGKNQKVKSLEDVALS